MFVDRRHALYMLGTALALFLMGAALASFLMGAVLAPSLNSAPSDRPVFAPSARPAFAEETVRKPGITVSCETDKAGTPNLCSRFSTSFSFTEKKRLPGVEVNGTSLSIAATAACPKNGTYAVSVYKGNTCFGTASFNRNGYTKATWNNLVPGTYYIEFSKPRDGYTVTF